MQQGNPGGRRGPRSGRDRTQDNVFGGSKKADVSFTVNVPFDITEGMPCRALYYEDESFYDAVIFKKSRTGWFVRFVEYPDDDPQDTDVSDILSVPASFPAPFAKIGSTKGHPKASPQVSPTTGQVVQPGHHAPQQFGAIASYPQTARSNKCRAGRQCIRPNCVYQHPNGREMDDVEWDACEALCYNDNMWYPAFRGPRTVSGGRLVAFVGYEDDLCQDTEERHTRTEKGAKNQRKKEQNDRLQNMQQDGHQNKHQDGHQNKHQDGHQSRQNDSHQPDKHQGCSKNGPDAEEQQRKGAKTGRGGKTVGPGRAGNKQSAGANEAEKSPEKAHDTTHKSGASPQKAATAQKETAADAAPPAPMIDLSKVPSDCIVVLSKFDARVTNTAIWSFSTKAVGMSPKLIKLFRGKKPSASEQGIAHRVNYAFIVFENPVDALKYLERGAGKHLAGRKVEMALKSTKELAYPGTSYDHGINAGFEDEGYTETKEVMQDSQVQLGSLYEAIVSGTAMMVDEDRSTSDGAELTFGINIVRSGRVVVHVLREGGITVRMGSDDMITNRARSTNIALTLPTGTDFVQKAKIKSQVLAALPNLNPDKIVIFDDMLTGAVEFVDGWYSNMYDASPIILVLVRVGMKGLQLGLANVSPNQVDVVTVFETDRCKEEDLIKDVSSLLAVLVQAKVERLFSLDMEYWPDSHTKDLNALALQIISDVGTWGESRRLFHYFPAGKDAAYSVDVHMNMNDILKASSQGALGAAKKFAEMLRESSQGQGLVSIAPMGPSGCASVIARSLQSVLGVQADNTHYFLMDSRNLAAGVARAAQWVSAGNKKVVRRCLHNYSCSVLAGSDVDGVTYTGIPWVSFGRELPVHCMVDELQCIDRVRQMEIKGANSMTLATIPLANVDEIKVTIDDNGLLIVTTLVGGELVVADPDCNTCSDLDEGTVEDVPPADSDFDEVLTLIRKITEA